MTSTDICQWCEEEIAGAQSCVSPPFHPECLFRVVCGSVAHIEHRCSCYVPGSIAGDARGLSRREAAAAALATWVARKEGHVAGRAG